MFQLSKEELERQARLRAKNQDAEETRRDMVTGRDSKSAPEGSLHPTISKEFNQQYGGSLYQADNYNPVSVETPINAKVERGGRSNSNRRRKKLNPLRRNSEASSNPISNADFIPRVRGKVGSRGKLTQDKKSVTEKSLDIYGRTIGRGLISSAYIWTNFIYLTFQLWLGIIAIIAIGIVFAIEYYIGSGVTKTAFDAIMAAIGVDWDFYLVATLCYMLVVVVCYIQLFGVAIQAKSLGLHPLGGRGGFFKTASFLMCFVLYWVPLANCLPLVNVYILSIQVSPR